MNDSNFPVVIALLLFLDVSFVDVMKLVVALNGRGDSECDC